MASTARCWAGPVDQAPRASGSSPQRVDCEPTSAGRISLPNTSASAVSAWAPAAAWAARGWKGVIVRTVKEFNEDQIPSVAGGVAYSCVVALFPAMAAFVSLYGLFADPAEVRHKMSLLDGVVPAGALDMLKDQLTRIAEHNIQDLDQLLPWNWNPSTTKLAA